MSCPTGLRSIDRATNQVSATLDFVPPGFRQVDVTPVGMTMTKDGTTAIITLGRATISPLLIRRHGRSKIYVLVGNRPWAVALSP